MLAFRKILFYMPEILINSESYINRTKGQQKLKNSDEIMHVSQHSPIDYKMKT